jgi:hypothetical protein
MSETVDRSNVVIQPPIAWALAIVAGLGLGWLYPMQFVPASIPRAWIGGGVFAVGFALAIWAIVTSSPIVPARYSLPALHLTVLAAFRSISRRVCLRSASLCTLLRISGRGRRSSSTCT